MAVMRTGTYTVHADTLEGGTLFLWGMRGNSVIDSFELKNHLFAWHEPSFYGTFIDTAELGYKEGVSLSPLQALNYFDGASFLVHGDSEWSRELKELMELAPAVREALVQGRFMPDYEQWKRGRLGWKLELPGELSAAAASPLARPWIEELAGVWAQQQPELRQAMHRLEQAHPLLTPEAGSGNLWLDEEDWLVAIGWVHDPSPFRTCLQFLEPQEGRGWRLRVALQDRARPDALVLASAEGVPADGEALPAGWQSELPRVPRDVQRWLHILPMLREEGEPERLREELPAEEAWEFLAQGALRLAEAGSAVLLPAWWERLRQMKPKLRGKLKSSVGAAGDSMFGISQIMQFDWKLAIGEAELTEAEFNELVDQKKRLVQFRGEWIQLDPDQVEQIRQTLKRVKKRKGLSLREVLEMQMLGDMPVPGSSEDLPDEEQIKMEVELNDHLRSLFDQLQRSAAIPEAELPSGFHGSLRRYQSEGVSWLLFLRRFGLGACLADDMGLGKTIQWITYLLSVKEEGGEHSPSLLICPTSVLGNWQKELERFAPSLNVHLHYGPQREKGASFAETAAKADLVLTSYTLSHMDEEELQSVYWSSICLDEAQNIKNAYTKQASAIRRLDGFHRIAMTGTPIENRLTELWSIFDFLNPGYLGSLREFSRRFVGLIEKNKDPEAVATVQKLVRPFLLRRMKKDPAVQLDLPEKDEAKTFVSLTAEQATLYENYIRDMFDRLEKLKPMERRGLILAALTKLKQVCNHPSLLLKETGGPWKERSNKVERLLDMVGELRQEGDRCLIFTQFVETGNLLQRALQEELGEKVMFLHGGTRKSARDEMIARFQDLSIPEEEAPGIFLLSLKAGGTGLNLTAANHVFHFDRWWNPAVENQATDRAYRIGQTRHVQVHKFVTLGTLEERIDEMIERKMGMSQQIVGTGENWITELSTDELRDLFILRREWIDQA